MQRRSRAVRSPRAPGAEPACRRAACPGAPRTVRTRARLGRAVCTACPGEHPRWLNTAYVSLGPRAAARAVPAGWGAHWAELATRLLVLVSALPLQLCARAAATPSRPRPDPEPHPKAQPRPNPDQVRALDCHLTLNLTLTLTLTP